MFSMPRGDLRRFLRVSRLPRLSGGVVLSINGGLTIISLRQLSGGQVDFLRTSIVRVHGMPSRHAVHEWVEQLLEVPRVLSFFIKTNLSILQVPSGFLCWLGRGDVLLVFRGDPWKYCGIL